MADEDASADARALYDDLAAEHLREPEVSVGRSLSNETLTVNGKIFAFVKDDRLVVKLPAARAAELVAAGRAAAFQSGGRRMREWITVPLPAAGGDEPWRGLMADARVYVAS
jgi:hypothetical protein